MTYATVPTAGAKFDRADATAEFALGTVLAGANGRRYIYGQAAAAITGSAACTISNSTFQITATAGSVNAGATLANGQFGWVYQTVIT